MKLAASSSCSGAPSTSVKAPDARAIQQGSAKRGSRPTTGRGIPGPGKVVTSPEAHAAVGRKAACPIPSSGLIPAGARGTRPKDQDPVAQASSRSSTRCASAAQGRWQGLADEWQQVEEGEGARAAAFTAQVLAQSALEQHMNLAGYDALGEDYFTDVEKAEAFWEQVLDPRQGASGAVDSTAPIAPMALHSTGSSFSSHGSSSHASMPCLLGAPTDTQTQAWLLTEGVAAALEAAGAPTPAFEAVFAALGSMGGKEVEQVRLRWYPQVCGAISS